MNRELELRKLGIGFISAAFVLAGFKWLTKSKNTEKVEPELVEDVLPKGAM